MIDFKVSLQNPWARGHNQHDFFCRDWQLSAHKHLEVQLTWFDWQTLVEFKLLTHWRGRDHAGPSVSVTLLGLMFNISMYDSRHWNYDDNCWQEYADYE
jgi:hypothetical protein